jgi:hypothetical protein
MSTRKPPTEPHPLFLPEGEGEEPPEIGFVNVKRWQNGRWVFAHRQYTPGDLDSLERLFELYGGGQYELVGRDKRNAKITALKRLELDGDPLPLTGEAPKPQPMQQPAPAPSGGGVLEGLLPMLLPLVVDYLKSSAAASRTQAEQQTQLMIAMMGRDAENARAHIQTMQQLHDRQAQSQGDLLRAVLERSGGGGGMENFLQAAEVVNQIRQGAVEAVAGADGGGDSMSEFANGVGTVVEQLSKVKALTGPEEPPPPTQPQQRQQQPPAAPNGPPKQHAAQ